MLVRMLNSLAVEAFGAVIASLLRSVIDGILRLAGTHKRDGKIIFRGLDLGLRLGNLLRQFAPHSAPRYIGRL